MECICALCEVRGVFGEMMEGHSCMYVVSTQHLAEGTLGLYARISTYVDFVSTEEKNANEKMDFFFDQ